MRLTVVTNNKMISLGVFAKDIFSDIVLTVDKTDNSFNVVQTVEDDTLEKVKKLPIDYGITQEIKDGIVSAFCKNRAEPDTDVGVRPDAKTEFNRTVKRS